MLNIFEKQLKKYNLLNPNEKILLAISGGVDSIVLFHLMQRIPAHKRPQISIAHINHQLRAESVHEEKFVRNLAQKNDIPFYVYRWSKNDHPESGIEVEARNIRYQFFKRIMNEHNLSTLMTAHHQDDQVETILMRLTRGSSLTQLTGIQEEQEFQEHTYLIRPLLGISKEEIYDFADKFQIDYIEDESNKELTYTRNRFRNGIIPLLKNENIQFNKHIEQFSSDLSDLLELTETYIHEIYKDVTKIKSGKINLNIEKFLKHKDSLQKAILFFLLSELYQDSIATYKTNYIEIIRKWIKNGDVNTQLDLQGGFAATKVYEKIIFNTKNENSQFNKDELYRIDQVDEWVQLSKTEFIGLFLEEVEESNKYSMSIDKSVLNLPLKIRHRQPGDRMKYKGLKGSKKIKDIFIDEKVPLIERDKSWLVEDNIGKIIWLIPYRKMNLFTTSETDKLTYVLKYKKINKYEENGA